MYFLFVWNVNAWIMMGGGVSHGTAPSPFVSHMPLGRREPTWVLRGVVFCCKASSACCTWPPAPELKEKPCRLCIFIFFPKRSTQIRAGPKRWNRDLPQPLCHEVWSGMVVFRCGAGRLGVCTFVVSGSTALAQPLVFYGGTVFCVQTLVPCEVAKTYQLSFGAFQFPSIFRREVQQPCVTERSFLFVCDCSVALCLL